MAGSGPSPTVSLVDGDTGLDTATGDSVDLWLPEVSAPRTVDVAARRPARPAFTVPPQRKWTVHLVHHSHLDIGYTDPQGVVLRNHLDYLDSALDLADATDELARRRAVPLDRRVRAAAAPLAGAPADASRRRAVRGA